MALPIWDRLTVPLGEFVEISGIGRTQVYKMLKSGELQSVAIGKKRMVLVSSYREALERAMREQLTYTPAVALGVRERTLRMFLTRSPRQCLRAPGSPRVKRRSSSETQPVGGGPTAFTPE